MSGSGRGSLANLRRSLAVPLALAACVLIAACGGGGGRASAKATAARLVSQAFSASGAVDSGRVALSLTLNLDGIKQLAGQPVTLDVSGPFQRDASGQLSADLSADIDAGGDSADVEVVLVPGHVYLGIGGAFYDLPRNGADGRRARGATGPSGGIFGALGTDPNDWLTDLHNVGNADVGGVATDHVSARVNVAALLGALADPAGSGAGSGSAGAGGSSGPTGATGSSGVTGASGLAGLLPLLAQAITSASANVYTGVADHIVRRLDLALSFSVPALGSAVLGGLSGGSLDFDATLTDLGKPQTITPPANAQPRSALLNGIFELESRFGSLASLFAGSGGVNLGGLIPGASTS